MVSLLVLLIPVGVIGAFVLVGYGFGTLGRVGFRAAGRQTRWVCGAAALAGVALALYTWGLIHLAGTALDASDGGTGSSPPLPCVMPGEGHEDADVADYTVGLVPLRFVCETADGGRYTVDSVPGYVNPAVPLFAVPALAWAATAAVRDARAKPKVF